MLQRSYHVVLTEFIPSITGDITPSNLERKYFPTKLGGLRIPVFSELQGIQYNNLRLQTDHLRTKITSQERRYKLIENLEVLKTRSPNFETVKILQSEKK